MAFGPVSPSTSWRILCEKSRPTTTGTGGRPSEARRSWYVAITEPWQGTKRIGCLLAYRVPISSKLPTRGTTYIWISLTVGEVPSVIAFLRRAPSP